MFDTGSTNFLWTDFYSEFATSLLKFENDRVALIKKIQEIYINANMKLPTLEKGNNIIDIDPFTIFGLFNKGISDENRIAIIKQVKVLFNIASSVPTSFDGIPVLNNMSATFYYFSGERGENDIDNLWNLFRYAISYADEQSNEADFIKTFDTVIAQKGVSWNITMGLYWIRPFTFINLDARNRKLLENNQSRFKPDLDVMKTLKKMVSAEKYLLLMKKIKETMSEYNNFPELSFDAWKRSTENKNEFFGENDIWLPSLEEYNPAITVEQWIELLNNPDVFTIGSLETVKRMKDYGGQATCKELSVKYGNTTQFYNMTSSQLAKRVHKITNCPVTKRENDNSKWWPILYVGKEADDETDGAFIWKLRDELSEALESVDLSHIKLYADKGGGTDMKTNISKNTILYGPPGTGKTYNTVSYAVAIIENKNLSEIKAEEYNDVLSRYNEYKSEGLIEFTTFHQSYGYEEFIEGIKPIMNSESDENDVKYTIEDGLFKTFCSRSSIPVAKKSSIELGLNKNPTIWKVSLWSTGDNPIRTECHENGHIRIGWDMYGAEITEDTDFSENGGKNVLNAFISQMKIGDIVFSCYSSTTIDAIGVVSGDYEWCGEEYDNLNRRRKVNWIVKGIREDIVEINGGNTMTLASVYRLKNIALSDAIAIIEKYLPQAVEEKKNHVFIIDEINRGNISKIFGELITLIEPTKRIGQTEGMKIRLPYSQTMFGVPDNVYILGTMNTADRSIAAIDTALRRRFRFKEIMPDADVLDGIVVDGVIIKNMLNKINKRITALYDREHTIGHSYFLPLKDNPTLDTLAVIFSDDIIPLLQEYFYEDYEKIRMVLGDNNKTIDDTDRFITAVQNDYNELFGNTEGFDDSFSYEINNEAFYNIKAYRKI